MVSDNRSCDSKIRALLRGQGRLHQDVNLPGQAYAMFLRSPHAHAKIVRIDTAAARGAPGVVAIYTGADYAADGLGMPKVSMPRKRPDGSADVRARSDRRCASIACVMSAIRWRWSSPRR